MQKVFQGRWNDQLLNPTARMYKQELGNKCFILQHDDQEQFWWMFGLKLNCNTLKGERTEWNRIN